jgi:hypothetical protein
MNTIEMAWATQALTTLKQMQQVTTVLGKGVGNITTPDGFFALWNETEIAASRLIAQLEEDLAK